MAQLFVLLSNEIVNVHSVLYCGGGCTDASTSTTADAASAAFERDKN